MIKDKRFEYNIFDTVFILQQFNKKQSNSLSKVMIDYHLF